jgi:hypothetical protein
VPSATLTAVAPPNPNLIHAPFHVDSTGLACLDLGAPTSLIAITNLNSFSYNSFLQSFDPPCVSGLNSPPNYTLVPGQARELQFGGIFPVPSGLNIFAQDVGPGTYNIRVDWGTALDCQYGTRLKAGVAPAVAITADIIASFLDPVAGEFLAPVLGLLIGQVLDQAELCSSLPPALPDITANTPQESMQTWLQILKALAWPVVCECVPGSPPPVAPPIPSVVQPSGWPVFPSLPPCSNADPCVQLQALTQAVARLQQGISQLYSFEQLVQRYVVPFSHIRGTRHSGLVNTGIAPIGRAVGLLVEVLEHPSGNKTFLGVPEYIFDLGWISVVDADGMIDEMRLTRQSTSWLSKLIPSAEQVGWGLRDGVRIDITELQAEP